MTLYEDFPHLLREHRQRLRLTQKECADLLDVSTRTVATWELGDDPKPKELVVIGTLAVLERQPGRTGK